MILRRMADGIRRQDWLTVVVEVLIVVVGIFRGLLNQINPLLADGEKPQ